MASPAGEELSVAARRRREGPLILLSPDRVTPPAGWYECSIPSNGRANLSGRPIHVGCSAWMEAHQSTRSGARPRRLGHSRARATGGTGVRRPRPPGGGPRPGQPVEGDVGKRRPDRPPAAPSSTAPTVHRCRTETEELMATNTAVPAHVLPHRPPAELLRLARRGVAEAAVTRPDGLRYATAHLAALRAAAAVLAVRATPTPGHRSRMTSVVGAADPGLPRTWGSGRRSSPPVPPSGPRPRRASRGWSPRGRPTTCSGPLSSSPRWWRWPSEWPTNPPGPRRGSDDCGRGPGGETWGSPAARRTPVAPGWPGRSTGPAISPRPPRPVGRPLVAGGGTVAAVAARRRSAGAPPWR